MDALRLFTLQHDLWDVWRDERPGEPFTISEAHPEPMIEDLVHEHNGEHPLNEIELWHEGGAVYISFWGRERLLSWFRERIGKAASAGSVSRT